MVKLEGSFVALVTPFTEDGVFDREAYRELIEWQIASGTDGIVPCGCTGEAATLTHQEQMGIIDFCLEVVAGRVPVIAGTGSNSTAEAVELTRHAAKAGADAALLITPYYNKPTPEGQFRHYRAVAEAADIPIVLYNVPSRTGTNMLPETVARIAREVESVVAIKEASGDIDQIATLASISDIAILSGNDSQTLPILALGGSGVVSVTANVLPAEVARVCRLWREGKVKEARELHLRLMKMHRAMFIETNPLPVKTVLAAMGRIKPVWRLPLCEMSAAGRERLMAVAAEYGLVG